MNQTNREVISAIHTAVPNSDEMDSFVAAYQSGDLMELGRLTAGLYNRYISDQRWRAQAIKNDDRFDLTKIGLDQVAAARFLGGVL